VTDDRTAVLARLTDFVREALLDPEQAQVLTPQTSLRGWGVLNSLGMTRLIAFIRDDLDTEIPLRDLTGGNFRSLDDITNLVLSARQTV
jgi:acyl carrier protein